MGRGSPPGLMRLLALGGQRGAALAQFEACRHLLQKELGVEPAPETTALYEQIRAGEFAADPRPPLTVTPSQPPVPPTPTHLPTWLMPFVGREKLLAEIRDHLLDPTCRLLTLTGPGGCGKTRLAVETAARLADQFPDGVYFAPLAALHSVDSIVPGVVQALEVTFSPEATRSSSCWIICARRLCCWCWTTSNTCWMGQRSLRISCRPPRRSRSW